MYLYWRRQHFKLLKNLVQRNNYKYNEYYINLYKLINLKYILNRRSRAWLQEYMITFIFNKNLYNIQSICIFSGKTRSIINFYQLYRMQLRDEFENLNLSSLYYYY